MTQVWSLGQKDPWRRKWQPTSVFLPMKSHGQRSLVDYSRWGSKRIRHDLMTKWQQQGMLTKGYTVYKKISNNTVELDLNQKNTLVFPVAQQVKKICLQCRRGRPILGLGRSPEEGNDNPLQYSSLKNPMDKGAWNSVVHRVTESNTTEHTWA